MFSNRIRRSEMIKREKKNKKNMSLKGMSYADWGRIARLQGRAQDEGKRSREESRHAAVSKANRAASLSGSCGLGRAGHLVRDERARSRGHSRGRNGAGGKRSGRSVDGSDGLDPDKGLGDGRRAGGSGGVCSDKRGGCEAEDRSNRGDLHFGLVSLPDWRRGNMDRIR
ncbi:hypothetical protein ASPWEDRAFT_65937 [Aspergillus wentii DTO 134E9]|uniref:Uncharacterized protein n=1 Tax=Aspergillus wentii DTO 134E9 TaxID=1073089 RepID=A0A1L9RVT8_ASPWE|nr:uncharacterized protein ASPWEDRAFT_65937 [Aspergillus wentii DTO 134E9]OJJ39039.1 hypothetical protein ASPWEDRAFT_65937 [Aspergillus wentii DTO 134E9]